MKKQENVKLINLLKMKEKKFTLDVMKQMMKEQNAKYVKMNF